MATISLHTNFTQAQICRIARNMQVACQAYGSGERKPTSLTVDDSNGNVVFTAPDGVSRTLSI